MTASPTSFFKALMLLSLALIATSEGRRLPRQPMSTGTALTNLSSYTVPLSNGATSLPSPTPGLKVKAITLGRGTQNYTCANGSTSAPVTIGAVADLLDASALLPLLPPSEGMEILNLLPSYLVSFDFASIENSSIPIIGRHFFDRTGVPTFDLGSTGLLRGHKGANISAPANACKGPNDRGTGAVDWLQLSDAGGSSVLSEGYRVETAGGKAPANCSGLQKDIQVQYAAQYWFYG